MHKIKNCGNCAHKFDADRNEYAKCARTYHYCSTMRKVIDHNTCDVNFSGWESIEPPLPKPPARSLRQWFYDTF